MMLAGGRSVEGNRTKAAGKQKPAKAKAKPKSKSSAKRK
jgi:hypothetical protein